ncbi:hydroxyisourate hydrolase [Variovorax saccharolyticus]|uniref:hydroxyisourate hydrolase n=1 Tax=Variovorax saccharolyticus TaxID=3053516 RepID=UPI0025792121|nr:MULTISPECIES: hydroxyisourate hydrolase [unclassified Variovorax]MDM0020332.1 hydroxyisourate hydrolase [Variovorax sp. J22R187]MDM0023967.1 hydroxyisourate hydrolase [Variovorax sp. J31P216]
MAGITTHVLDIATGRPIAGMQVELFDLAVSPPALLRRSQTNADGRTDGPMLAAGAARTGHFELRFQVGAHFKASDGLVDEVPLRFTLFDAAQHYHVPLLCSPWYVSTYRGS